MVIFNCVLFHQAFNPSCPTLTCSCRATALEEIHPSYTKPSISHQKPTYRKTSLVFLSLELLSSYQSHSISFASTLCAGPAAEAFMIVITLCHPVSRGSVSLRDSNPQSHPVIQPNYLQQEIDARTLVAGCKIAMGILQQDAMKDTFGQVWMMKMRS